VGVGRIGCIGFLSLESSEYSVGSAANLPEGSSAAEGGGGWGEAVCIKDLPCFDSLPTPPLCLIRVLLLVSKGEEVEEEERIWVIEVSGINISLWFGTTAKLRFFFTYPSFTL
jgi:hypothetical protein